MADAPEPSAPPEPARSLMHRWFIQYNPLYLVSATLVLVGVILLSQGLAGGGTLAQLGITAVAEVYAWALIGGAALLVRIHLRRPAVMLTLLAAAYQCDLTLHTETCAHLGLAGALGSGLWLASFGAKLRAVAWAMRVELSKSAWIVAMLGAVAVALLPWLFRLADGHTGSVLLAVGVYAVLAAGLWTSRQVRTPTATTGWPATVARRSLRAVWAGWAAMLLVHMSFWLSQVPELDGHVLVPVAALLMTRWAERESTVWVLSLGTLGAVGLMMPEFFSLTAGLVSATLALRAVRWPRRVRAPASMASAQTDDVYRTEAEDPPAPPSPRDVQTVFVPAEPDARLRLLCGSLGCLYLAGWAQGWSGGAWPPHVAWLDLMLVAASVAIVWRTRFYAVLALPMVTLTHLVVSLKLVAGPRSMLEWGVVCVGGGFGLLVLSLAVSVVWRHRVVRRRWGTSTAIREPVGS